MLAMLLIRVTFVLYKQRKTKLSSQTLQSRRILMATMHGHFAVYESPNSCIRAHFCCGLLEVGSTISAFRFSLCVSIANYDAF